LVLAFMSIGEADRAAIVFNWICDKKFDDGSYWMGVTFPDGVIWPEERTSWTAAAVLLAHDALHDLTPASRIFSHDFWSKQESIHRIGVNASLALPDRYGESTFQPSRG
ncbi:MAG: hypothetical protein L7F78_15790, partial [Syntrophales bacterium LBB04]|nr:hypothetical protein [Syntrophales bacterium LBB04]